MRNLATGLQGILFWIYFPTVIVAVGAVGWAIHPSLGLLAGFGIFAAWVVRCLRRFHHHWAPNINGENAYAILGVPQNADVPTIRRAFRRLVQKYHPDGVPATERENATATFIRLSQAYELLADEEKRFQYDGWIEDLEGDVPLFVEAYQKLKDEDKHPIYEVFDALYNPSRLPPDVDPDDLVDDDPEADSWVDDEESMVADPPRNQLPGRPQPVAGPDAASRTQTKPATTERPDEPVDVDIPDAVREALGMPVLRSGASNKPSETANQSGSKSADRKQTPCLGCGVPCPVPPVGGRALCAKCRGASDRG